MRYAGSYNNDGKKAMSQYVTFGSDEDPDEQDLFEILEQAGVDPASYELVETESLHDGRKRAIFHHI